MSIAAKDGAGAAITLESSGNSPDNLVHYIGSVVPGTTATKLGKAEDAVHGSGDVGVMALAVRADTATATGADGDYVPLLTDSAGKLHVNVGAVTPGTTALLLGKAEDAAHSSGDVGVMMLAVREAAATDLSAGNTDGDYEPLQVDASGRLHVNAGGSGALFLGKAEDAAHSSSDVGVMALGVRSAADLDRSAGPTDGDYEPFALDDAGRVKVNAADSRVVVDITTTCDTSANGAGDVLFDRVTTGTISRIAAGVVHLESITVLDEDDQAAANMTLVFLDADVTLGTVNAAPSITDANSRKIVGTVVVLSTDFIDLGGVKVANIKNVGLTMKCAAASQALFVAGITAGTPTQTADGVKLKLAFRN